MTSDSYDELDRSFLRVLRSIGLANDLDETLAAELAADIDATDVDQRRIKVLMRYYRAAGDSERARERMRRDRFFLHRATDRVTAHELVSRLAELTEELPLAKLQRIGSDDGPLVLRAGDDFSAIHDDELDELQSEDTVAVNGIVQAFNSLIARSNLPFRFLPLLGTDEFEPYVALQRDAMIVMANAGCLERWGLDALNEFALW
ncbi:MAG: hypothetical protein R3A47_11170 [Polyangiales bacterium]